MTSNNQNGIGSGISNQDELAAALQKELGQAAGYLDLKYREWCIQHPDEVLSKTYLRLFIYYYQRSFLIRVSIVYS